MKKLKDKLKRVKKKNRSKDYLLLDLESSNLYALFGEKNGDCTNNTCSSGTNKTCKNDKCATASMSNSGCSNSGCG